MDMENVYKRISGHKKLCLLIQTDITVTASKDFHGKEVTFPYLGSVTIAKFGFHENRRVVRY